VDADVAADDARAGEYAWPSWQAWAALAVGVLAVTAHSALSIGTSVLMMAGNPCPWVFDTTGSYLPAWRAYTGIMTLSLVPAWLLWRSGGAISRTS